MDRKQQKKTEAVGGATFCNKRDAHGEKKYHQGKRKEQQNLFLPPSF